MDKVLVCLYVPALNERYDLFAPKDLEIAELTNILAKGVSDLSGGQYLASNCELLAMLHPDALLNPAKTLRDYSVLDGTKLMLL